MGFPQQQGTTRQQENDGSRCSPAVPDVMTMPRLVYLCLNDIPQVAGDRLLMVSQSIT